MHTRGQGCIYEIYQYSVKSTEAPGDGYVFQEEFIYIEKQRKNRKGLSDKMAFAGTCGSCTDLCAGCIA